MTIIRLIAAVWLMALAAPAQAKGPILRFSFATDPDYTVVMVRGLYGENIATINEVRFPRPVIYPAPDYDNAVIAAGVFASQDFGDDDTIIYMRLQRTRGRHWKVLQCVVTGLYPAPDHNAQDDVSATKIARTALVRALAARKPIPGEQCKPGEEIQKGSRVY